ncbi:MAG: sulfatase, partial [Planctomycetota bacterium]
RHGGVTCWEGGLRVAALARWPGEIPAGCVVEQPLWSPDLLVACAKLAGASLPTDRVLDGKDPLPVLTESAASPHDSFYFRYRTHAALRKGPWKIVREKPEQSWQLYHLKRDIGETRNLADDHPRQLAELATTFAEWEQSISTSSSP